MQTLRVKLNIPKQGAYGAALDAFDRISDIHEDQAVFQVNQTEYVTEDTWGFSVTHTAKNHSKAEFAQTTSLSKIEQAMANAASHTFEKRITTKNDTRSHSDSDSKR